MKKKRKQKKYPLNLAFCIHDNEEDFFLLTKGYYPYKEIMKAIKKEFPEYLEDYKDMKITKEYFRIIPHREFSVYYYPTKKGRGAFPGMRIEFY